MTKILLTAFEPFGDDAINPSQEVLHHISHVPAGADLTTLLLPVSFREAPRLLREAVAAHQPDTVISLGLAGGRSGFNLERIAVNLADARIPDNTGYQPVDEPLYPGEAAAYFSTLPLRQIQAALEAEKIPAVLSSTAGLYVCNAVFYQAARLQAQGLIRQVGFIHLPYLPQQAAEKNLPSLSLEEMVRGVERVTAVCTVPDNPQS